MIKKTKETTKQLADSLSNKYDRDYLAAFRYILTRLYLNMVPILIFMVRRHGVVIPVRLVGYREMDWEHQH